MRSNPRLSGTTHNVFGIQTGMAISFLVRKDRPVVAKNLRRQGKVLVADFPHAVWDYKLGNRSAGEWVLDQHADYRPKDKTVAEKFHSYRLADHVDEVVELLKKVTRESVGLLGNLGGMR